MNWHEIKLSSVVESIDYGHTASAAKRPIGPKFLRITDIQNNIVDWSTVPFCSCTDRELQQYSLRNGDIVFARTGATTGKSFLISNCPDSVVFASYLIRVRPKSDIEPRFLAQFFKTRGYWKQITSNLNGSTQPGVNATSLKNLLVPLPPLSEQRRIAAILDKADSIWRKRQLAIEKCENFLRSVFLDMFGDPVTNPKGWDRTKLSSVCKKITDGTHHSPQITPAGVPYVTAKHLRPYGLDFESNPWFISLEDHRQIYARCNPEIGDILYIKDGATTGIAAINNYDFEFSMLSSLALLKPDYAVISSEYLNDWLNNVRVKSRALRNISGAAITRLTLRKIKDFEIELPPLEVQKSYSLIRHNLFELMNKQRKVMNNQRRLVHCLTHIAFLGELTNQTADTLLKEAASA